MRVRHVLVFAFLLVVAAATLFVGFGGCTLPERQAGEPRPASRRNVSDDDDVFIITPKGQMGLEIAPGIGVDPSTGQMTPGIGI